MNFSCPNFFFWKRYCPTFIKRLIGIHSTRETDSSGLLIILLMKLILSKYFPSSGGMPLTLILSIVSDCDLQTRVDPAKDIIYVNGNRLSKKLPPKVYFALNKPKGLVIAALMGFNCLFFQGS